MNKFLQTSDSLVFCLSDLSDLPIKTIKSYVLLRFEATALAYTTTLLSSAFVYE